MNESPDTIYEELRRNSAKREPGAHYDKVNLRAIFVVTLYLAFCTALFTLLWFLLGKDIPVAARGMLVLGVLLLAVLSVLLVPFPGFRLEIVDAKADVVTSGTAARLTVLWGFLWRLLVYSPVASILLGLGGAVAVALYAAFQGFFDVRPAFYKIGTFLCFFFSQAVILFPLVFWWLRMYGRQYRICMAVGKGSSA